MVQLSQGGRFPSACRSRGPTCLKLPLPLGLQPLQATAAALLLFLGAPLRVHDANVLPVRSLRHAGEAPQVFGFLTGGTIVAVVVEKVCHRTRKLQRRKVVSALDGTTKPRSDPNRPERRVAFRDGNQRSKRHARRRRQPQASRRDRQQRRGEYRQPSAPTS
jgi:hypothetical protein